MTAATHPKSRRQEIKADPHFREISAAPGGGGAARSVLREKAHRAFMDHLMSGGIKPGLLVSQRQLCDATGSTIGSMREALKRLEAERIVRLIPQRGVMIREPSETEINDVYAMRGFVEPAAARRYAETGDLTRIAEVREQTLEILERKAKDRDELAQLSRERSRVDDLLHEVILANLGNAVVGELFDRLRIVVQISRVALPPRFLDSLPGLREHLLVIAAIEARDAAEAERLMFWHLEMGRRRSVGID